MTTDNNMAVKSTLIPELRPLTPPSPGFPFNMPHLIKLVEMRPDMWAWTPGLEGSSEHSRVYWNLICSALVNKYFHMPLHKKQEIEQAVRAEWYELRKSFLDSIMKKRNGENPIHPYHDNLKFLIKDLNMIHDDALRKCGKQIEEEIDMTDIDGNNGSQSQGIAEDAIYVIKQENTEDTRTISGLRVMDENEAFFVSLLPAVSKFCEDDRFSFRLQVLKIVQEIKQKRIELDKHNK